MAQSGNTNPGFTTFIPLTDNFPIRMTRRETMNDHGKGNGMSAYRSCIILFFLIIALSQSAAAADTMFRANAEHTGIYDNGGIEPTNTELWRFTTGGDVYSSPAVVNGVVYVGSDDKNLYAIDAATGKEKWRFATGSGVSSSPAVSNGVVYVGSTDKNFYAIDAVTGKEKWRFATGYWGWSSPAVSNGVVYVGSYDNNLYAIDAVTGNEKWRFATGDDVTSSPAVSNGVVYVGSYDNNLYAIDAEMGTEKWRFATGSGVSSSPAVSNGVVYVGSNDGNLYAIDAVTGTEKWQFKTGRIVSSSPAIANGVVYVGSWDKYLYAIDAATGTVKWWFAMEGEVHSSPAVANGIVYVGRRLVNMYEIDAAMLAIDAATGTEKWQFETGNDLWSSPAVANGIVYFGSFDDNLYAVGQVPSTPITTPTDVSTPRIQSTPSSLPPSNSGDSNLTLPIIVILVVLFLAGGGYAIYRRKKKPAGTPISPVRQFTPKPLTPRQPPPELSDRYTEFELIGKGGFARVFKAKRKDGQYVAVKIPISLDESTGKSFIAELQNWTRLDHPNIVKVYNFNIMPSPYFEMELCDNSLAEMKKPIESEEAAWLIFNICEGLKFTHAQKIIHRDLKPQNILLKNGVPKISDWGLSRVITESTSTTAASFTPNYAAPEQIGKKAKDERTDIWQLGVIFYELATGVLPFTGDSMVEVMSSIATKNPTLPSTIIPSSRDVEGMIMKCLEKNPGKRYQSVLEFQKDLALYLRVTYTESLKMSVTAKDYNRSAYYCGDLVMVNLLTGDMKSAYKYLLDFVHYSKGDVKAEAQELSEQLKMRMEMGVTEIPDELITKAEIIVHQVSAGFRNKG